MLTCRVIMRSLHSCDTYIRDRMLCAFTPRVLLIVVLLEISSSSAKKFVVMTYRGKKVLRITIGNEDSLKWPNANYFL